MEDKEEFVKQVMSEYEGTFIYYGSWDQYRDLYYKYRSKRIFFCKSEKLVLPYYVKSFWDKVFFRKGKRCESSSGGAVNAMGIVACGLFIHCPTTLELSEYHFLVSRLRAVKGYNPYPIVDVYSRKVYHLRVDSTKAQVDELYFKITGRNK